MVGYMRRFAPAFLEAKEMLPSLGTINYARVRDIIGQNQLIIDQTWNVHRPDDIPEDMVADRWERAAKLVHEALGAVPEQLQWTYRLLCGLGSHDLSAMRELLGRPKKVLAARQWHNAGFIAALLEYDDFVVTYETGVDDQLRFDAHIEVYGEAAQMRVQYDTPYVRHFPTTLVVEKTEGDELHRSVSRPHLKDPYTARARVLPRHDDRGLRAEDDPRGLRRGHGALRRADPGDGRDLRLTVSPKRALFGKTVPECRAATEEMGRIGR